MTAAPTRNRPFAACRNGSVGAAAVAGWPSTTAASFRGASDCPSARNSPAAIAAARRSVSLK